MANATADRHRLQYRLIGISEGQPEPIGNGLPLARSEMAKLALLVWIALLLKAAVAPITFIFITL
ncbi:hypothetical protein M8494_36085 [Serratia ureilytica]